MSISSKIGLHIESDDFDPARLGRCSIVKLVNPSVSFKARVRAQVGPDCLIVIRFMEDNQDLRAPSVRTAQWFGAHLPQIQAMNDPNVLWEGLNEIADSDADAFAIFEAERLRTLHAHGYRVAVGSWSVGTPNLPVWAKYTPVLGAMKAGDAVALHEYWIDRADLSNPWHVGRWRLVPELDGVPIVVTECGRDVAEGRGHAGWKGQVSENEYLDELREYGRLLDQFPNVLGATVFTGGRIYPQWKDFNVNDIWPRVVAEYPERSPKPGPEPEPVKPPVVPPAPPANEIVGPGFPRIERVCFPMKNINKAWYESGHYFGAYDDHPNRAEDYNLESMGNTDLGEPLVAPFRGLVICATNFGGGHGKVVGILGVDSAGVLTVCRMKHLQTIPITIRPGTWVECGQDIGTVGNSDGYYAGAHLHLEIVQHAVPGPIESWQNRAYQFVQPSAWFQQHGVDAATVRRVTMMDRA